jgi:hypothetical protein
MLSAHNPLRQTARDVPLEKARGWLDAVLSDVELAERDRDPQAPAMRRWAIEAVCIVADRKTAQEGF